MEPGGHAALTVHCRRRPSFLRRNLRATLRCAMMGTSQSILSAKTRVPIDDEKEEDVRPAKRRKVRASVGSTTLRSIENLPARVRHASKVEPSSSTRIDDITFDHPPTVSGKELRVDILQIINDKLAKQERKLSNEQNGPPVEVSVLCKVTVWSPDPKEDVYGLRNPDGFPPKPILLFTTQKVGKIQTMHGSNGHSRVRLPGPFIIPEEELLINRRIWTPRLSTKRFSNLGLLDDYSVEISLEVNDLSDPAGLWPPTSLGTITELGARTPLGRRIRQGALGWEDIHLHSKTSLSLRSLNRSNQKRVDIELGITDATSENKHHVNTAASLHVDLRWYQPVALRLPTARPRTLRIRSLQVKDEDVLITYTHSTQNIDGSITEQQADLRGMGFLCALCQQKEPSFDLLRFHLKSSHDDFDFHFQRQPLDRDMIFHVELSSNNAAVMDVLPDQTLQIGPPRGPFNLQRYINGDDSWINSRSGTLDSDRSSTTRTTRSISSRSLLSLQTNGESTKSSNATSADADSIMSNVLEGISLCESTNEVVDSELITKLPKSTTKLPISPTAFDQNYNEMRRLVKPRPHREELIVPRTKYLLVHPISKQSLVPGDKQPETDDEADMIWQLAKHRDIINDFDDVTDDEKDYIIHWDTFAIQEKFTSKKPVAAALLRFVRENVRWFEARPSRPKEFGKHAAVLIMREAITPKCFEECCKLLAAYDPEQPEAMDVCGPLAISKDRARQDCVCGKLVSMPYGQHGVICEGQVRITSLFLILFLSFHSKLLVKRLIH
jgi:hypothetical protein